MSNQSEVDYDKQFQDDLAKATALSLEQQALDDYRRAKKYGTAAHYYSERAQTQSPSLQHTHSAPQRQQSTESAMAFYAQLRTRYQQSRGHSTDLGTSTPIPPSRRHSEANNNVSLNVAAVTAASRERSKTPPSTLPECDLIWFSSPIAKEAQPNTFEKLIEDLQNLQTTAPQTALVPFGPVAAAPITPMHAAASYRCTPPPPMAGTPAHNAAALQHYAAAVGAGAAAVGGAAGGSMQLVPFTPAPAQQQQQQQKKPLTSEELQKLYNMPLQQQQQQQQYYKQQQQQYMAAIMPAYPPRAGYVPTVGGFTAPTHAANYTQSAPATAAAAAAFTPPQFPPTVSHYGFQYGAMPGNTTLYYGAPHISATAVSNVAATAAPMPLTKSQSAAAAIVSNGSNGGAVGGGAAGLRRQTPPARKPQRTGNDLIDLSQEDEYVCAVALADICI